MNHQATEEFFTPEEQERIRQAVIRAETDTSGEIATMVVSRSDSYREAETLASVLGAALLAFLVAIATQHVTIWTYLPMTLLLYVPARRFVAVVPALKRPFISTLRLREAVKERAVRAFYEKGLYRTKDETGILIFISLFERKVWILGDRGINERIPVDTWQNLVAILTKGIREGHSCDSLCLVIELCGNELSRHFPASCLNLNELPDELIKER